MNQRLGEPFNRPVKMILSSVADELKLGKLRVADILREQLGEGVKTS